MKTFNLSKAIRRLLFMFLLFGGLYYAKGFLIPVAFSALLAMLFTPLSHKLEDKGIPKGLAILLCILLILLLIAGVGALVAWQITDITSNADQIQQQFTNTLNKLKVYISSNLGISAAEQQQMLRQQSSGASSGAAQTVTGIIAGLGGILTNTVLVLVYTFLFMYYRQHLRGFALKLAPPAEKAETEAIIDDAAGVAQKYLSGMAIMIACLWVMYGIGFSVVGVKSALFFAILCGLLEIVPFIGNITGTTITVLFSLAQGASGNTVLGILAVYAIVQFVQTYLLEPLVVGKAVDINPLFTILVLVLGEIVWGIPGMILALPILGIFKIVFDHIQPLKPYGYLVGEEDNGKDKTHPLAKKLKSLFGSKELKHD